MIVSTPYRSNDLVINIITGKKLTNIRAIGTDESIILTPFVRFSLEQALEFVNDAELIEVTPNHTRLRKKFLKENERKRAGQLDQKDCLTPSLFCF